MFIFAPVDFKAKTHLLHKRQYRDGSRAKRPESTNQ